MSRPLSAKAKLRAYFLEHVGEVIEGETLRELTGISEWARRVRELRDEEGMDIVSHNDRSDLKRSQYMLRSEIPRPSFAREVSKETRAYVLDRNGNTCQMCGAVAGEPHPYDSGRRTRLHIGHIIDKSHGGLDEPSNLRAICSVCNEGAANLTLPRPQSIQLLTQIRRASGTVQVDALDWLIKKFPDEARKRLESN